VSSSFFEQMNFEQMTLLLSIDNKTCLGRFQDCGRGMS
jgi:hypothetical protein